MLNVRRFFQDDDSPIEIHISATTPANQDTPAVNPSSTNIHMIEFSHRSGAKNDARFPQVDEILDRLDTNVRTVGGTLRRPD